MKRIKFEMTDYLVVEIISDRINQKSIGIKCIPARWVERITNDSGLNTQNLIIRYPEEETSKTTLQVKNKEPRNQTWPSYRALVKLVTGSYENACRALDFLTEKDIMNLPSTSREPPNNQMNNAELIATPSTSFKRRSTDERITTNDDSLPKKKRESAIRSETNLKILIQSGQLLSNKQKVSPKKLLSLRKDERTETLEKLIRAQEFNKLDKLIYKDIFKIPQDALEISSDDSDNDGEPETSRPREESILEAVLKDMPYIPTTIEQHVVALQSGKTSEKPKTPLPETGYGRREVTDTSQISSTKRLEQHTETPKGSKTPLRGTMVTDASQIFSIKLLDLYKQPNTPKGSKTPRRENVVTDTSQISFTKDLEQNKEPKTPKGYNTPLRETVVTGTSPISSLKHLEQHKEPNTPIRSKTPLCETVVTGTNQISSTKCLEQHKNSPKGSKTPLRETVVIGTSPISSMKHLEQHKEPNTPIRSTNPLCETVVSGTCQISSAKCLEQHKQPNSPKGSKTPLRETAVTDTNQIFSTKPLGPHNEPTTNKGRGQFSVDAEMSTLGDLICKLVPKNFENRATDDGADDIKKLEDIYNSILSAKEHLNAVYLEKSEGIRNALKAINLGVPELKQGLSLPSIQQLRENRLGVRGEPQPSTSRQG